MVPVVPLSDPDSLASLALVSTDSFDVASVVGSVVSLADIELAVVVGAVVEVGAVGSPVMPVVPVSVPDSPVAPVSLGQPAAVASNSAAAKGPVRSFIGGWTARPDGIPTGGWNRGELERAPATRSKGA